MSLAVANRHGVIDLESKGSADLLPQVRGTFLP